MSETKTDDADDKVRAVVRAYNDAVRDNDADGFRRAFHPSAPVVQYQERDGEIDVKSLDEFIAQIDGLHTRFGNAVETSDEIHVQVSGYIASARVPFRFQMGDKAFAGVNIFTFALDGADWRIMSKVYSL